MGSNKLLILGAGRYNVPSILKAKKSGFFTFVADRNPGAPGLQVADQALAIDLNDCDALIAAVTAHGGIDGVVSMAEVGVRAAAKISASLALPSISEAAAANATSKAAMRRLWQTFGEYSVPFEVASTAEDAEQAARKLGNFPLIFKPDRSFGGSRGVSRVESLSEVRKAFELARNGGLVGSKVVIEPWVEGTEHSCEVLIWKGKTSVLCIGQKVKSRLPFRVDVSVQYPAPLTAAQESTVADMCDKAVKALGLTQGVAHVEFSYTNRGPVLFELGARCGGGHTPEIASYVSGIDEFVEACRMACGMAPIGFASTSRHAADYRFLIFAPGVVESITIPDAVVENVNVLDVGVTFRPGDTLLPLQSTSDRAGFLVVTGKTLDEAVGIADRGCRAITLHYQDGTTRHAYELAEFQELAHS